jgi:hypothetical protein
MTDRPMTVARFLEESGVAERLERRRQEEARAGRLILSAPPQSTYYESLGSPPNTATEETTMPDQPAPSPGFCENAGCDVIVYRRQDEATNCPGCGRFGRLKDQDADEPDAPAELTVGDRVTVTGSTIVQNGTTGVILFTANGWAQVKLDVGGDVYQLSTSVLRASS